MSSDVKIPDWAMEEALEALKAARPAYDSEEQYDAHWEAIAIALLAAEQRGIEKATPALAKAEQALKDWLHVYAPDLCKQE